MEIMELQDVVKLETFLTECVPNIWTRLQSASKLSKSSPALAVHEVTSTVLKAHQIINWELLRSTVAISNQQDLEAVVTAIYAWRSTGRLVYRLSDNDRQAQMEMLSLDPFQSIRHPAGLIIGKSGCWYGAFVYFSYSTARQKIALDTLLLGHGQYFKTSLWLPAISPLFAVLDRISPKELTEPMINSAKICLGEVAPYLEAAGMLNTRALVLNKHDNLTLVNIVERSK